MKQRVKKIVIPIAGMGTRLLPFCKVVPKHFVPLLNKPVIQWIVEEVVKSGIKEVIFVSDRRNYAITRDHFQPSPRLEENLRQSGKKDLLDDIRKISRLAKFRFVFQNEPKGNGHAVLYAKKLVGNEPFAMSWGDHLLLSRTSKPLFKQLIEVFAKYGQSVLNLNQTNDVGTTKYGIVNPKLVKNRLYQILSVVEKPGVEAALSRLALLGMYLFTPKIFDILEKTPPGKNQEIWLADAINTLCQKEKVYGLVTDNNDFDAGNKLGYITSNITLGLSDPEIKDELKQWLTSIKF